MYLIEGANFEFIIDTSQLFFFPQMYIFTQTAHPTMNSIALNGVYQSMNVVSLENLYLSCNDVCGWSSVLNGIKYAIRRQQQRYFVSLRLKSFYINNVKI